MRKFSVREAKKQLSRLVDQAAVGDPFIITKAGKPVVKVEGLDAPKTSTVRRLELFAFRWNRNAALVFCFVAHFLRKPVPTFRKCALGFLAGQIAVPPDFDQMGAPEIARMFGIDR